MFHPDLDFDAPSGVALLAELGVRRETVREVVEDEHAIRCPERDPPWPAYGFASLAPEPPFRTTCTRRRRRIFPARPRHFPRRNGGGGGLEEGERKGVRESEPGPRSFATHRHQPDHEEIVMAFGLNRVELIGRLGADVTVNLSV